MRPISATRVVDVSYRVEGPHMTGDIKEAAITFQAPLLHSSLAAYYADGKVLRLEAIDADIHPTRCRIHWDFQKAGSNELPAEIFILPLAEELLTDYTGLLGLVLHVSQESGLYTRVGMCDISWSYGEEPWLGDTQKARWRVGRKPHEDMLELLEPLPIQRVVLI
jgi:hypothetical protein